MMYDQREKALRVHQWALNSAREAGSVAGQKSGLTEGIRVLQQLLDDQPSSVATLVEYSSEELAQQMVKLQDRLRSRGN